MELEVILKLLLSAVLGGIIGLERHLSRQGTGLRSNILIAVGSTLLTILSFKVTEAVKSADPARLTAQIIIAVGILGAGAIIRERFAINGLTHAATIWMVAAIGIAVGSSYYLTAFVVTFFMVSILVSLKYISSMLNLQQQLYPYVISTEDRASVLIEVKRIITESGIKYIDAKMKKKDDGYEIEIALNTSKNKNREFLEKVMQLPGVKEIISEHL